MSNVNFECFSGFSWLSEFFYPSPATSESFIYNYNSLSSKKVIVELETLPLYASISMLPLLNGFPLPESEIYIFDEERKTLSSLMSIYESGKHLPCCRKTR